MRNPFARVAKSDAPRPSLRERAASLRASAARVVRRRPKDVLPEPNPEEAVAAFHAAITEYDRLSRNAVHGYPDLKRGDGGSWTRRSLTLAMEDGEITPAEFARLYPLAAERQHRLDAAALATNIGALQAVAYADNFTCAAEAMRAATKADADGEDDPILAAITETRRLFEIVRSASSLPQPVGMLVPLPQLKAATNAFWAYVDDVLLKTVPTTGAGCAALGRYAVEFLRTEGYVLDEEGNEHVRILDLIARSPLL
ncbi:hypothetical protein [Methylobacterium sp. J-090]|uniref:hypothetical protein n=1 Tax=Methylobacterium sp. J-090 TaxID=2836666 RepID=UPI001FBBD4F5|nr:hypothetical protein [Methylobacterium sp. J-090]MCJ2079858.1 hypothetical protein [Methylobacterium sp. J-090]